MARRTGCGSLEIIKLPSSDTGSASNSTPATARASFADLDGDGRLDLIEAGAALDGVPPLRIFHNRDQGFTEVSRD